MKTEKQYDITIAAASYYFKALKKKVLVKHKLYGGIMVSVCNT